MFATTAEPTALRTASAMANHDIGSEGFIFFGVADRPEHAERIAELYSINPLQIGEFLVTGTEHELTALGRNRDKQMQWLTQRIRSSKLDPAFASQLAGSLSVFDYKGYAIWSLRPKANAAPVSWDGKFHAREGNATNELQGAAVTELMRRFL